MAWVADCQVPAMTTTTTTARRRDDDADDDDDDDADDDDDDDDKTLLHASIVPHACISKNKNTLCQKLIKRT